MLPGGISKSGGTGVGGQSSTGGGHMPGGGGGIGRSLLIQPPGPPCDGRSGGDAGATGTM